MAMAPDIDDVNAFEAVGQAVAISFKICGITG